MLKLLRRNRVPTEVGSGSYKSALSGGRKSLSEHDLGSPEPSNYTKGLAAAHTSNKNDDVQHPGCLGPHLPFCTVSPLSLDENAHS